MSLEVDGFGGRLWFREYFIRKQDYSVRILAKKKGREMKKIYYLKLYIEGSIKQLLSKTSLIKVVKEC